MQDGQLLAASGDSDGGAPLPLKTTPAAQAASLSLATLPTEAVIAGDAAIIARDPAADGAVVRSYRVTDIEQGRTREGEAYALFKHESGMLLAVAEQVAAVADTAAAKAYLEGLSFEVDA